MRTEFARIQPAIPLVDVVAVGTAFHWFDGPAALRERHRVLKPGGGLGLVWLQRNESILWMAELVPLVDTYRPADARRYGETPWQEAFASEEGRRLFTPLEYASFPFEYAVDHATAVQRTATTSFVAAMPLAQRAEVLARVTAFLDAHPSTSGRAHIGCPHRAEVYWGKRRD